MARVRKDNDQRYLLREEADSLGGDDSRISDGDIVAWTATALTVAAKEPNWDAAFGWGDHATAGYLTSFTETDPTVPSHVKSITTTEKSNWNTAFGWGDHATAGYLTSFTESDPTVPSHVKSITTTEKSNWNTAFGWGDHATAGYLTSYTETDPTVPSHVKSITTTEKSNWNTAFGWGDHATAGYLTSYTETDTLASVTGRGATTTNAVTVGALTATGIMQGVWTNNGAANSSSKIIKLTQAQYNAIGTKDGNALYIIVG